MSYNSDPLYYHTKVNFDELLEVRDKALWFKIDGLKVWMPKKCCRHLNKSNNEVYIWTKVYESNMMKARAFIKNLNETDNNSEKQGNLLH